MAGGASTGPVEVLVVSGVPAHLSETDLRRRALVTMRGRLESGTGRFDVGRTVQLPPVRELQVAVVSAQGASAVVLDGASVLIGHHGAGPAVSLIAFWGPWWAGITLIGVVGILLTSAWAWQGWVVARLDGVRRLPVRLWLLLVACPPPLRPDGAACHSGAQPRRKPGRRDTVGGDRCRDGMGACCDEWDGLRAGHCPG